MDRVYLGQRPQANQMSGARRRQCGGGGRRKKSLSVVVDRKEKG